jgi:hypothetical protein
MRAAQKPENISPAFSLCRSNLILRHPPQKGGKDTCFPGQRNKTSVILLRSVSPNKKGKVCPA